MADRKGNGFGQAMKKQWILLISLPLIAACSFSPSTPHPTPTQVYSVDILASAANLKVGETTTVTAVIRGEFGNPMYYLEIQDGTGAHGSYRITLLGDGTIFETSGTSDILELVSAHADYRRVTGVFRARAPGSAQAFASINGEIIGTDSTGHAFWNYVTVKSEGARITVVGS